MPYDSAGFWVKTGGNPNHDEHGRFASGAGGISEVGAARNAQSTALHEAAAKLVISDDPTSQIGRMTAEARDHSAEAARLSVRASQVNTARAHDAAFRAHARAASAHGDVVGRSQVFHENREAVTAHRQVMRAHRELANQHHQAASNSPI